MTIAMQRFTPDMQNRRSLMRHCSTFKNARFVVLFQKTLVPKTHSTL